MIDDNFWKKDVSTQDIFDLFEVGICIDLMHPGNKLRWDLCYAAIHAVEARYKKELVLKTLLEALEKIERTSL